MEVTLKDDTDNVTVIVQHSEIWQLTHPDGQAVDMTVGQALAWITATMEASTPSTDDPNPI